ncbi:oxidoreductase [Streptomyces sp. AJS327]|uniref:NAD(P)/FAD-dependent oxidoreductase n=1 Tax=Streptomyces sp. AJS327 TaxID=2545265 RepID=UPI0015E0327A|nr:FAD-dependent oxidoreductase [Streptomyces sp. AJS327]MBA0052855.1 oxidoreductase [Streptomyces sp. AJS327]
MPRHVVVVGAGYGGLATAKLVAEQRGTRVTLVNADAHFTERVRLHQVAAGQRVRRRPLVELLGEAPVRLVIGRVVAIQPEDREVRLADGTSLAYDTLIYALGSSGNPNGAPGAAEHAYPLAVAEDAERLRERLAVTERVTVVGGGLTGIEAASELAESHPELSVRLVTGGHLGAGLSRRGTRHLRRTFARLRVQLHEHTRVVEVRPDGVRLADGTLLDADTVVWATGFRAPELAREAGFAVHEDGRMLVDWTLRSLSHPEVYAVGDAALACSPDGHHLRMACAVAVPSAGHLSRVVADRAAGAEPRALRHRFVTRCVSLGRRDALVQYVRADDSPVERMVLTGRAAALVKELIVRGALTAQRRPGLARLASR